MAEKTEAPTPKKLADARRKGQVGKSQDLSGVVVLLGGLLLLRMVGGGMISGITDTMAGAFTNLNAYDDLDAGNLTGDGTHVMMLLIQILMPFLLALALIAILGNVLQTGPLLSLHPLKPQASRINPITNAKRILGKEALVNLVKNLAKVGIVGAVIVLAVRGRATEILGLGAERPESAAGHLAQISFEVMAIGAVALLIVGLLDFVWQRYRFHRELRMSKQEIKDENRQSEGDPAVKGRLRQMRRSFFNRMMASVPEATVVITNPTHIAVALRYDPVEDDAPVVVAKGERLIAQRIKAIAAEHHIPMWEDKPLARALYQSAPVDQPIPGHLFQAVAEVLAFIFRLRAGLPGRPPAPHTDLAMAEVA